MPGRLSPLTISTALFIIIGSAAGRSPAAAAAASPSPSPSSSPGILDTVVVTAQRRPTPLRSTAREVYVIDAGELRRLGAQTLADALRFIPGSVVQSYGPLGALQTVALRGASSEQTLVLIDGRPANEADTGVADFSDLPLDGVERIEVVEGGASTLYGSAAVGGVINVITADRVRDDAYVELGYAGSVSSGLGVARGDDGSLLVRANFRHARAQNVFAYPAFGSAPGGVRTNDDADVQDSSATLGRTFGALRARLRVEDDASTIGAPGPNLAGPPAACCISYLARQQRYVGRSDLSLSAPGGRGIWTLELYVDDQRLHFYDPTPPFPFDDLTHVATHGFGVRRTQQIGPTDSLTFGYDSRGDRATFGAPGSVSASTTAWYVQDDAQLGGVFSVSAGVRGERTQGTLPSTLPSVGAQLRLPGGIALRANYARAFRAPDLDERYFPGFGNPALEPEYAGTGDIGVVKSFATGVAALTAFGSDTSNLIVSEPIDAFGDVEPFNVSRSMVRGANADLRWSPARGSSLHLAYTDYFVAKDLSAGTRLLYRPTASGGAEYFCAKGRDAYGASVSFVGRRFADERNATLLPGYAALGVSFAHRVNEHYIVSARVDNLLRNHAEDQLGFPTNGTTLTIRLEARR